MSEKIQHKLNSIIVFDGVCNLCNHSVNFLLKKDKKKIFLFTPFQSKYGQSIINHGSENENSDKTVFYLRENQLYKKSTAALYILKDLGGAYSLLFVFIIVPRFLRDFVYSVISRNRYKWFGKKDSCRIPNAEEKNRFLL